MYRGKISDFENRIDQEAQKISWDDLKNLIDFAYIAMHGRFAEDGTLQGILEILDIPYLGSKVSASALGMDKIIQKNILKSHGIETPAGIILTATEIDDFEKNEKKFLKKLKENNLKVPLVIKPHHEGSSLGVSVIFDLKDLPQALIKASSINNQKKQSVIIEEKIEGMEFSCMSLVDYKTGTFILLPPTEIVSEVGSNLWDYEQKYMPGRATKYTPARCSQEQIELIQNTCIRVRQILGITNIARIDGFLTHDGKVIIIDPNTLSAMGPASLLFKQAAEINMNHTQVINHLIETELEFYGNKIEFQKNIQESSQKNKTRIAVLMGGKSNEKEISLESGRNITYKLSPNAYEVMPVFVSSKFELYKLDQRELVQNNTSEIETNLKQENKISWSDLQKISDFVFIALHGGEGENGSVQGALEMIGMPYNGSGVLASAICMDKFKTNQYLRSHGIEIPNQRLLSKEEYLLDSQKILKELSTLNFPLIAKPHDEGCSVLVYKAKNLEELKNSIDTIFGNKKDYVLIEEFIHGMELTVGVIGNEKPQALIPSQAIAKESILSIEEKFMPGAGENQTPAILPASILKFVQSEVEKVYEIIGCKGYSRIDCFYQTAEQSPTKNHRVVIIEINSLPGMTPATCIFHQAAEIGIMPMDFIDLIVKFGFENHKNETKEDIISNNQIKQPKQEEAIKVENIETPVLHCEIETLTLLPF